MVFRMIHVKDFLLPRDNVWSLDFLDIINKHLIHHRSVDAGTSPSPDNSQPDGFLDRLGVFTWPLLQVARKGVINSFKWS